MQKDIILIGGAHVDIGGVPQHPLRNGEKNYGKVNLKAGGVAFNVAYNLSRLSINPQLISLMCDDANARIVSDACTDNNIDISNSIQLKDKETPKYLYILDYMGDTNMGISDMELYNEITPEFLQTKLDLINSYKLCFIDGNLPFDSLKFLLKNVKVPTVVDPVSVDHCQKLKSIIHLAYVIKPNEKEMEELSGTGDIKKAKDYFLNKGVKEVFFSLGERGLYYADGKTSERIVHPVENIINTNGAGDAMTAGLIYGKINGFSLQDTAKAGVAAACISLQSSPETGSHLSVNKLKAKMEEIK